MHDPLRLGAVLLSFVAAVNASTWSGKVLNPDSTGRSGVTVSLAGTSLSTVTAGDGTWSLSQTTSIRKHSLPIGIPSGHLRVEDGRLRVVLGGRDPLGRAPTGSSEGMVLRSVMAARTLAKQPDTLIYLWNGKVILRDTVSTSSSDMVRIFDTTWNAEVVYGSVTDVRDGKMYRTVRIGSQTWMAQNLNYAGAGACPDASRARDASLRDLDGCLAFGRLYPWSAAVGLADSCDTKVCSLLVAKQRQGICPAGWHIPSDAEWQTMEMAAGMSPTEAGEWLWRGKTVGVALKASFGWFKPLVPGTDLYGFRVVPAGEYVFDTDTTLFLGSLASMWTSTETEAANAIHRNFIDDDAKVYRYTIFSKSAGLSLRCVQDD